MSQSAMERLEELAVDDVLGELTAEEQRELGALLQQFPEFKREGVERAVAATVAVGVARTAEPLPELLSRRLQRDALDYLGRTAPAVERSGSKARTPWPRRAAIWTGWAAAAGVALAWWLVPGAGRPSAPIVVSAAVATPEGTRLESARDRLLAQRRDALFVQKFAPGPDRTAREMTGDVVWDDQRQEGYMRLSGLQPNDPHREQYQLWIFDAERDERYPVDGGVFDIGTSGANIVRIRAALPVHHAAIFAITVEQPGGVVVSSRARVAGLAKPG